MTDGGGRATRHTELSGCPLPAGTLVLPMIAAASLDRDVPESTKVDLRVRTNGICRSVVALIDASDRISPGWSCAQSSVNGIGGSRTTG